ncbi:efflux transporter outer membrane subunit [Undibacterium sp. RuRC25W]|uniref:efflux transporter outer membrane subunit n=1 Tax=Undibacterium sp. RuRC25W TaxID=3413047 RepID=UPI003BF1427C
MSHNNIITISTPRDLSDRIGFLATIIASFALCACASSTMQPPKPLSFAIPTTWSDPTVVGQDTLVQWWTRFHDPVLDTLVNQSLNNNLSIKTAQTALRQAWALRDIAAAALFPTLDGSASAQRNRISGTGSSNLFQVDATANWAPDIFGAARSGRNAAEDAALSSKASLGDTQVMITAEVGLTYISLRDSQARFSIAQQNLTNQEETLRITQWRQQAGFLSILEVEQARTAVEQTRAQLPLLQIAIKQNQHALALLTGQPPQMLETILSAAQPVPKTEGELALTIPTETLRQRADIRAAEYTVLAARERTNQAEAARLPSFSLGGSIGLSALTAGMLTDGSSLVSALIAGISLPIFDGGAKRAQVSLQQAAFDQAQLAYETAVLTALSDVENALLALRNDSQRFQSLRVASESAATASHLANQRYSSGLIDFQVVLQTQLTQLATQDALASANAVVSSDQIRLYKALGGGWQADSEKDSATNASSETPTKNKSTLIATP